ncbi:MAG: RelA/SpoT domain-containing protein [Burkholderiales bacterium]|nr:RelA/SpoT domain-containing protein [Bacteroidia bacterium]
MKNIILEDFNNKKEMLNQFKDRIENLLVDLLNENNIVIHQLSSRIKDFENLEKTIDGKQINYTCLNDITDLVGLRIITYHENEVVVIADLIRKEFKEDVLNLRNKRILESNEFGFKSIQLICSLNDMKTAYIEYSPYKDIKCEIQICSILQHTWAEIEPIFGYKEQTVMPEVSSINFNRLAVLSETADKEFDRIIKGELTKHEKEILRFIKEESQNVELNQTNLNYLILTNEVFSKASDIISKNTKATLYRDSEQDGNIKRFNLFKIKTIKELEDSLIKYEKEYLAFVNELTKDMSYEKLSIGLCMFYFQHFLAAKSENVGLVEKYLDYDGEPIGYGSDTAYTLIEIYRSSKNINI